MHVLETMYIQNNYVGWAEGSKSPTLHNLRTRAQNRGKSILGSPIFKCSAAH